MNKYWQNIHRQYHEMKAFYLEGERELERYGEEANADPLWAAYMAYYEIRKQVEYDRYVQQELA